MQNFITPDHCPCQWIHGPRTGSPPAEQWQPAIGEKGRESHRDGQGESLLRHKRSPWRRLAPRITAAVIKESPIRMTQSWHIRTKRTDHGLCDARASKRGAEKITRLVKGVRADDREDIVLHEILLQPSDSRAKNGVSAFIRILCPSLLRPESAAGKVCKVRVLDPRLHALARPGGRARSTSWRRMRAPSPRSRKSPRRSYRHPGRGWHRRQ